MVLLDDEEMPKQRLNEPLWWTSSTIDRYLAPIPDEGAPQGKRSFFPSIFSPPRICELYLAPIPDEGAPQGKRSFSPQKNFPRDIVSFNQQFSRIHLHHDIDSLLLSADSKNFLRTHTLKLAQTRPVPAHAAARRCL